jgi:hypothetical protein
VGSALKHRLTRARAVPAIIVGAVVLRLITGVGFANYDTLYALAWGGQLARGSTPAYDTAVAPTPHPLLEMIGFVLSPLSPRTIEDVVVALGFLALAACAWVIFELGAQWFGRAAGALAAIVLLTRVPILSYGVRAYLDVPYLLLILAALLMLARDPRAHVRVLVLLALAGLLRPEAWVFSALYLVYLARSMPRGRELGGLALLAGSAPLIWLISDLAITGDLFWSLTNTRHTAHELGRVTGIANVPQYIPRRIGEIARPPVLVGSAIGAALSLRWLSSRALPPAAAGVLAVAVFAVLAAVGLPINTRYAFLVASIFALFTGAAVFGWVNLERGDARRRPWAVLGALVLVALIAYAPASYRGADREMGKLARQQQIKNDLLALVADRSVTLRCGPVGVPNHAPVPLLALYLHSSPREIVNGAVTSSQPTGTYLDPASSEVETDYVLDPRDPIVKVSVPPGFREVRANRSWIAFERCG